MKLRLQIVAGIYLSTISHSQYYEEFDRPKLSLSKFYRAKSFVCYIDSVIYRDQRQNQSIYTPFTTTVFN